MTEGQPGQVCNGRNDNIPLGLGIPFNPSDHVYYPSEESFIQHNERLFPPLMNQNCPSTVSPVYRALIDQNGIITCISVNRICTIISGLWLLGPISTPDRNISYVSCPENKLETGYYGNASCQLPGQNTGTRTFPGELSWWRIVQQVFLPTNTLSTNWIVRNRWFQLGPTRESTVGLVEWFKYLWGRFSNGVNIDTYKHYIDFAAKNGLPYIILLDEGWSPTTDVTVSIPEGMSWASKIWPGKGVESCGFYGMRWIKTWTKRWPNIPNGVIKGINCWLYAAQWCGNGQLLWAHCPRLQNILPITHFHGCWQTNRFLAMSSHMQWHVRCARQRME